MANSPQARKRAIGLTEVLAGHCEPEDAIQQLSDGFAFLDAGSETPPDPVELLSSSRMRQALEIFQKDFEYVVIDGAPLLPVSDSVALSPLVEGVVLVVDSGTPKAIIARAHAKLQFARANTIGVVLKGCDSRSAVALGHRYAPPHPGRPADRAQAGSGDTRGDAGAERRAGASQHRR